MTWLTTDDRWTWNEVFDDWRQMDMEWRGWRLTTDGHEMTWLTIDDIWIWNDLQHVRAEVKRNITITW